MRRPSALLGAAPPASRPPDHDDPAGPAGPAGPVGPADDRRRVSAGWTIAVVVLSLLMGGLLDADSLVASVAGLPYSRARTVELHLVEPFRTVSHWTGLDLPHRLLADFSGSNQPSSRSLASVPTPRRSAPSGPSRPRAPRVTSTRPVVAPPRPKFGAPVTAPPPTTAAPTTTALPAPTTVVTAPPGPAVRTPTPQDPLRVWLAGDSMMGEIAQSFAAATAKDPLVSATSDVQVGTGLDRPDVYPWASAVATEVNSANPDVVVLTLGTNDDQDMSVNGQLLVRATPAWQAEYARRVAQLLDELAAPGRLVVWLEVPPVTRPRLNQTKDAVNAAVRSVAATHPSVRVIDMGPPLSGPGLAFETYVTGPSGQPVQIRAGDGIHLTFAGANLITPLVLATIHQYCQFS